MRSLGVRLMIVTMAASLGCGGGTQPVTSPSPAGPANVAGAWTGTLTFNGTLSQGPITLTLTQASGSAAVNGTWAAKNEWSGTIDGSVSGSTFAGQLVWNYTGTGQALSKCSATASLLGNAGGNSITWTSSSINRGAGSVFCDLGVASLRIDATK
jgi:hypothetical protein